jgi:hypothetical protein
MTRLDALSRAVRAWAPLAGDVLRVFFPFRRAEERPIGRLCARALAVIDPEGRAVVGGTPSAASAAALMLVAILSVAALLGLAAAATIESSGGGPLLAIALALVIPTIVGASIAPAMLAPFAALEGEPGIEASLVRSFELSARQGASSTALDGSLVGALTGSTLALPLGVAEITGGAALVTGIIALVWLVHAPALGATLLARTYVGAAGRPAFDRSREPRVVAGIRAVAGLVALPLLALGAALLAAALVPSTMVALAPDDARALVASRSHVPLARGERSVVLDPRSGLEVRELEAGIEIATADGGGAGTIFGAAGESRAPMRVLELEVDGRAAWGALLTRRHPYLVVFDGDGVRLDDGPGDRIARRLGREGAVALLLAVALVALLASRLRRDIGIARALDAPVIDPTAAPRAGVALLSGRLVLASPPRPGTTALGSLRHAGDATLRAADGVIVSIPADAPVLVPSADPIVDGLEVAIVARHDRVAPPSLRDGAQPFPDGGQVVLGDREHAAEMLLTRAARRASLLGLAIAALLLLTAARIAFFL